MSTTTSGHGFLLEWSEVFLKCMLVGSRRIALTAVERDLELPAEAINELLTLARVLSLARRFRAQRVPVAVHHTAPFGQSLKRLRTHGLIKKVGGRYKYYLTTLGRPVGIAALKLREVVTIPTLNQPFPRYLFKVFTALRTIELARD